MDTIELALTPQLQEVVTALEMIEIERFLGAYQFSAIGRPCKDRTAIARAFVAKAVFNSSTTEALIDRLKTDISLRRICGLSSTHAVPDKSRFSRAFAAFAQARLPERVPVAPIAVMPALPKKRGRPRKDAPVVLVKKIFIRIERQQTQSLAGMLCDLPRACDTGTKLDSKGYKSSWNGYKLHIDTGDGDIPISCILSSASLHDSQVMMPLITTSARVQYCYNIADATCL